MLNKKITNIKARNSKEKRFKTNLGRLWEGTIKLIEDLNTNDYENCKRYNSKR